MFPPFNQEIAHHYCLELIDDINNNLLKIEQITAISEERKNHGVMIGSLVCWDKINNCRVILHAISGISQQIICNQATTNKENSTYVKNKIKHFIVPPIVDNEKINSVLQKNDILIHQLTEQINTLKKDNSFSTKQKISELNQERTKLTDESLHKVFSLYSFTSIDKSKITLNQIINKKNKLPPTGTGDCCAPKLLSFAFDNNLIPISMDEVFFGNNTKNRKTGFSYPPCDERCGYILPSILGLEILYFDSEIAVINKPFGMLSVPGKGEDKQDCAVSRIKKLFPNCISQPSVHRLDMETSGILIFGLTKKAHAELNRQFSEGLVEKKYVALLDGILNSSKGFASPKKGEQNGKIELKFRLDVKNRPHQIYDEENGKLGITLWEKIGIEKYTNPVTNETKQVTRIIFTPKTGRTHQLRLAASDIHGFALPIIGDTLYGNRKPGERLMLHAFEISFYHPVTYQKMHFTCTSEF